MEKVASDAQLSNAELSNITAFAFGTTLASPAFGLSNEKVAEHTKKFTDRMKVAASRIEKMLPVLEGYATQPAK